MSDKVKAHDEAVSGMERDICAPRGHEPMWIVYFYDADVPPVIFAMDGAREAAYGYWQERSKSWNCVLLETMTKPAPEPLSDGTPFECEFSCGDSRPHNHARPSPFAPKTYDDERDALKVMANAQVNYGNTLGGGASDVDMTDQGCTCKPRTDGQPLEFDDACDWCNGARPEAAPALKAQEGNDNALTESGWKRVAGGAIDVASMSHEDEVNADMVSYMKRHFLSPALPPSDLASLAKKLAAELACAARMLASEGYGTKDFDAVLAEAKKAGLL